MFPTLFNTTIQIKQVSGSESSNQPVQTIGTAGSAIPARIENTDKLIDEVGNVIIGSAYIFYVPGDTTVKPNDVVVCNSVDYKVTGVKDAYGMGGIDHKEIITLKQD